MKFVPILFAICAIAASGAASANTVDISGNTAATGKFFDRPEVSGTAVATGSHVAYEVFSLTVSESGIYSFYGGFDGGVRYPNFLFVYSGNFSPPAPLMNFIVGDGNYAGGSTAYAYTSLAARDVYYLVYTGLDTAAQGPYIGEVYGPGDITIGAVSPVPEPTSIAMLLTGAGMLVGRIQRRKKLDISAAS